MPFNMKGFPSLRQEKLLSLGNRYVKLTSLTGNIFVEANEITMPNGAFQ